MLGVKGMEQRAIEIGHRYGVIIHVRSSLSHAMGTLIKENIHMETRSVTGCTVSEKVMMVTLNHYPNQSNEIANLFIRLAENEVNVDMISQTQSTDGTINLAFTASADDLIAVDEVLDVVLSNHPMVEAHKDLNVAKVSVVGSGMRHQTGVAAELFKLFASNHIQFKLVTTSEISISYTMNKAYMERAVTLISENFSL